MWSGGGEQSAPNAGSKGCTLRRELTCSGASLKLVCFSPSSTGSSNHCQCQTVPPCGGRLWRPLPHRTTALIPPTLGGHLGCVQGRATRKCRTAGVHAFFMNIAQPIFVRTHIRTLPYWWNHLFWNALIFVSKGAARPQSGGCASSHVHRSCPGVPVASLTHRCLVSFAFCIF